MNLQQILAKAKSLPNPNNDRYNWIVDFERPAKEHRFFIIDLQESRIYYSWFTSHGSGSGPLEQCLTVSNVPDSHESCSGLVKCIGTYNGKYGVSIKLKGLDETNSNMESRNIVIHRSEYISQEYMRVHIFPGRSWGCITLDPFFADSVINKIKYSYGHITPPK